MGEIIYVVSQALALSYIAAGDGDPVPKLDDLDVEPGGLNHVVVDEDFAGERYTSADDFPVVFDESRRDHKGANFSEDLSYEILASDVQPAFRIRVDIAETEVNNFAGGIRDTVEDVEIVETALRRCQKPIVLLSCVGRAFLHAAQVR